MLWHCITGGIIGIFWALPMLATNTAGLGSLIGHSASPASNPIIFLTESAQTFQPTAVAAVIGWLASDGNT